jgi:hypothetical protein
MDEPMHLHYVSDVAPAQWIFARLHAFAQDAGSIIPSGFESYARIFHPAGRRDRDIERAVTWREIAEANGRMVHPEMQFGHIAGVWRHPSPQPQLWTSEPLRGSLPAELGHALSDVLAPHTSTPDRCWFAVWEGWGGLELPAGVPKVGTPQRGYYLAKGPLSAALDSVDHFDRSASLWWPEDRAWCVTTEVDLSWTYVGGTQDCIASILVHPGLEALPAQLSDRVTYTGDRINPAPPHPPSA